MPHICGRWHSSRLRRHSGLTEAGEASDAAMQSRAPTHEEIARLAYWYWEQRGRRHGSAWEDWLRAESELKGE